MKVEQVYSIVNDLAKQVLGEEAPATVDATNVIDVGTATFDATSVDNYVRKLVDHIGKVIFVNRPYSGRAPSILMDGWEFGAVVEKIDAGIPEAEVNPAWNLQDGQTYDQDKFTAPVDVVAKFWKDKVTFQVPFSFVEDQVKSAFSNVDQLNGFFSMIYTKIDTSFTIRLDSLIMTTIGNFACAVYKNANAVTAVNLLSNYNTKYTKTLKAATALSDLDFLKYCCMQMKLYSDRLTNVSKLFNMGGRIRHTAKDLQKIIMLDEFAESANVYLQSDTFHNEFVKFPNSDKVSYWQGTGTDYDFDSISSLEMTIKDKDGASQTVSISGLLCVIFDRDALGVNNFNRRVTNHINGYGEFINYWYKMDAQYFNDYNENFVLFYIAD